MNTLDIKPKTQNLTETPVSFLNGTPDSPRLIVLLPEADVNYADVTHSIWELANAHHARVQFLGLCKDADHEASIRRRLVMMSGMAQDVNLQIESKVEYGKDWVKVIKSNWKDGDMLVCFREHNAGGLRGPLSKILEEQFQTSVYLLSGLITQEYGRPNWFSQFYAWAGSIGILAVFFLVQVRIEPQADWAHESLMYISILAEVGLLWIWNSFFQ